MITLIAFIHFDVNYRRPLIFNLITLILMASFLTCNNINKMFVFNQYNEAWYELIIKKHPSHTTSQQVLQFTAFVPTVGLSYFFCCRWIWNLFQHWIKTACWSNYFIVLSEREREREREREWEREWEREKE